MRSVVLSMVLLLGISGCGASGDTTELGRGEESASSAPASPSDGATYAPSPTEPSQTPAPTPTRKARPAQPRQDQTGIDVSHHQGSIDWAQVADDRQRVRFAYLKASEGSSFVDERFQTNAEQAHAAGLRVGGYHYFTVCSAGAPQAEHFADVLDQAKVPLKMPPVIDLELQTACSTPPDRASMIAEVQAFLDVVERRTGRKVVVYSFPDFEERYRLAGAIDRRQWVRQLGDTPPGRDWWVWQRSQTASVSGIAGGVDLNVLRGGR